LSICDFSAAWREGKWLRLRKHRVPEEKRKERKGKKEDKKEGKSDVNIFPAIRLGSCAIPWRVIKAVLRSTKGASVQQAALPKARHHPTASRRKHIFPRLRKVPGRKKVRFQRKKPLDWSRRCFCCPQSPYSWNLPKVH